MYLGEIQKLRSGADPKGVIRDPAKNRLIVIPAYERWLTEEERRQMLEKKRANALEKGAAA